MKIHVRLRKIDKRSIKNEEPHSFREVLGLEFNAQRDKNSTGEVWAGVLKKKISDFS